MTQIDLSFAAGVTQSTISSLENDDVNATLETLQKVSAALGATVPELFNPVPEDQILSQFRSLAPDHQAAVAAMIAALAAK